MKIIFLFHFISFFGLSYNQTREENLRIIKNYENEEPSKVFRAFHSFFNKNYKIDSELGLKKYIVFLENLLKNSNLMNSTKLLNKLNKTLKNRTNRFKPNRNNSEIKNIDWTYAFLPPRRQNECRSCWAFAVAGAMEGNYFKKDQCEDKYYLSPQQLIDCNIENYGCEGGLFDEGFDFTKREGLIREDQYSYKHKLGSCEFFSRNEPRLTISDYEFCLDCEFEEWYNLLACGPIAAYINGDLLQLYENGVLELNTCGPLNHAVVVVGFNRTSDGDEIIIRNSWGTDWGEGGYLRLRSQGNQNSKTCYVMQFAYLPYTEPRFEPKFHYVNMKYGNSPDKIKLSKGEQLVINIEGKEKTTLLDIKGMDIDKKINSIKVRETNYCKPSFNPKSFFKKKIEFSPTEKHNLELVYSNKHVSVYIDDL